MHARNSPPPPSLTGVPVPLGKSSSKRRSSDIISLLVSIYGSKDLFINEYRTLLADRLLHQFNYSAERSAPLPPPGVSWAGSSRLPLPGFAPFSPLFQTPE